MSTPPTEIHVHTDCAYAGITDPRKLAYKAGWHRLHNGLTTPDVWRTVEAALDAYEGRHGTCDPEPEREHYPTMDESGVPPPCIRCGAVHERDGKPTCPGHRTNEDGVLVACRKFRVRGAAVCFSHGARAPQVKAAAARRVEAAKLERAVVTYGAKREIGHLQALVELLHDSAGHVAWLRDQVQAQAPEALVWGVADEIDRGSGEFPGVDRKSTAAPSVWLELYHRERRLLLDLSKELARLELDWDAREAIRRQGAALARVVRETVRLLGHDPSDERVVKAFLAALRSANAGPGAELMIEGRVD